MYNIYIYYIFLGVQQFRDTFEWGRHRLASITSASYFQYLLPLPLRKSHPQRTDTWLSDVQGLEGKATGGAVLAMACSAEVLGYQSSIKPDRSNGFPFCRHHQTRQQKQLWKRKGFFCSQSQVAAHPCGDGKAAAHIRRQEQRGTHSCFSRSVIFSTSAEPRTTNTGNSAAQSGLCLPISSSVIQTKPQRPRHRLTSSRRPPLRLSSQMILCGVKLTVKSNHDNCLLNWNLLACP